MQDLCKKIKFIDLLLILNWLFISIILIKHLFIFLYWVDYSFILSNINIIYIIYDFNWELSLFWVFIYTILFFIFINNILEFFWKINMNFNGIYKILDSKFLSFLVLITIYLCIFLWVYQYYNNYKSNNGIVYWVEQKQIKTDDIYLIRKEEYIVEYIDYYWKFYSKKENSYIYILLDKVNKKDFNLNKIKEIKDKRIEILNLLNNDKFLETIYIKGYCWLKPLINLDNISKIEYMNTNIFNNKNTICSIQKNKKI